MQIVNRALYDYFMSFKDKNDSLSSQKIKQITEEEFLSKFLPAVKVILDYKKSNYVYSISIYATEKDKKEDKNDIWVTFDSLAATCLRFSTKSDTLFKEVEQKFPVIIDIAIVNNTLRNNILKQTLSPYVRKSIEDKYIQMDQPNYKTLLLMRKHGSCTLQLIWKAPPTISDLELLLHKNIYRLEEIVRNPTTAPELLKAIYYIAKDDNYVWLRLRVLNNPNCSKEFIEEIFNTTNNAHEFKAILENPLVERCETREKTKT
jgi:hypothetical protein